MDKTKIAVSLFLALVNAYLVCVCECWLSVHCGQGNGVMISFNWIQCENSGYEEKNPFKCADADRYIRLIIVQKNTLSETF